MSKEVSKMTPQLHLSPWTDTETTLQGKSPKLQERKIELALIGKEGTKVRDALIGKRLSLDLTFPIGFDCDRARREDILYPVAAFIKAFIEESKESTQSRAERKRG
nr:hypothetical protein [Tanacetum cinerariifolium]